MAKPSSSQMDLHALDVVLDDAEGLASTNVQDALVELSGRSVGTAGGDLSGDYPDPAVAQVSGLNLYSEGNDLTSQYRGANAQTLRVYNTRTDAANGEYAAMSWNASTLQIGTFQQGSGVARSLMLAVGGINAWCLNVNGTLYPVQDAKYSIGNAQNRVLNIVGSGGFAAGLSTRTQSLALNSGWFAVDCDATAGVIAVTLESAPTIGQIHLVKKIDASANAVLVSGSQPIDGKPSFALYFQYESVTLQYSGTSWNVIAEVLKRKFAWATPASATGTTAETTLGSFTLPAGVMGPTDLCRITADFSWPNNSNSKTPRVRFGNGLVHSTSQTTSGSLAGIWNILNRGSQQSQITTSQGMCGVGTSAANATTLSVDTTQAVTISLTGQLGVATDTITLESCLIEVLNF